MTDDLHFISRKGTDGEFRNLISTNKYAFDMMPDMGEFWRYLNSIGDNDNLKEMEDGDEGVRVDRELEDTHGLIGYVLPEDWKYKFVDKCSAEIDIKKIDKYIGEIGFRLAFKFACECEFYEEEDFKEALSTDAGVRRLFYAMLWGLIDINDRCNTDNNMPYFEEVDKDAYEEMMNPAEDEEVIEYEFVVPITDDAFAKIGVATPRCA
jgi:hypothetical protein